MRLDGRELVALSSSLTFSVMGPFTSTELRLSSAERALLEGLSERIRAIRDRAWALQLAEAESTRAGTIARRLGASAEVSFAADEERLIAAALETTAIEFEEGEAATVTGAAEYGVTSATFVALRRRLSATSHPWTRRPPAGG